MDVEAVPPVDESEKRAVIEALEHVGIRVEVTPAAYDSAWRAAGQRDGAEGDDAEGYTPSPRSTRGATRA